MQLMMSVLGESATIEQLLKMSWTFVNDRSDSQSAVVVGLAVYTTGTYSLILNPSPAVDDI